MDDIELPPLPEPNEPPVFGYTSADLKAYARAAIAADRAKREIPSAQPAPGAITLDRSDAVNLARNLLEVRNCKGITERGVRVLCKAVMAMDQALAAAPAATQPAPTEECNVCGGVVLLTARTATQPATEESSAPATQPAWPMKDHELRELVNTLRDVAINYHATQQLRERIAQVVHPWARPPTQPEGQEAWQPIETAPKDRTEILCLNSTGRIRIETGTFMHHLLDAAKVDEEECYFTHWAPLPALPAVQAGGGK